MVGWVIVGIVVVAVVSLLLLIVKNEPFASLKYHSAKYCVAGRSGECGDHPEIQAMAGIPFFSLFSASNLSLFT